MDTTYVPNRNAADGRPVVVQSGNQQILSYISNPNTEGLIPADPALAAVAVPVGGAGQWYQWKISTKTWV
jgi:hypothetical protein